MEDALIISDLHIGSDVCKSKQLIHFLENLPNSRRLVLNGDILDSTQARLTKKHWKLLSKIRSLSDRLEVVWVWGNHDGDAESVAHLLGVRYIPQYQFVSGVNKVCCVHGDIWDTFVGKYPRIVYVADWVYWIIQKVDPSYRLAKIVKRRSKMYLKCEERVWQNALLFGRAHHFDMICCGHTHHPYIRAGNVTYCNSGTWTELPCHYLAVKNGGVELREFS